jgi:hypothetical protein
MVPEGTSFRSKLGGLADGLKEGNEGQAEIEDGS